MRKAVENRIYNGTLANMKVTNVIILFLLITTSYAQECEDRAIHELTKLHSRTVSIRDSIISVIKTAELKIKAETDVAKKETLRLEVDSLWNISDKNDIETLKITIDYCKKNPSCAYSFGLVNTQVARQPGKNFYEDFENIYNNASKEIRESEAGKRMAEKLILFKQSMVGSKAPKFSGTDMYDQKLSLDDFHGEKYVLIDFWASWCAPCREEIPFLDKLRDKYHESGFEIISISVDQDLTKWKNAVIKESIENWKHFSTIQNESSAEKDYFVNGIPHKVLVDHYGKIIGKWKATGELNKRELENQLLQIFGY